MIGLITASALYLLGAALADEYVETTEEEQLVVSGVPYMPKWLRYVVIAAWPVCVLFALVAPMPKEPNE
jgi:hypothetical protein